MYELRITVFTDFMQEFVQSTIRAFVKGMIQYHFQSGKATKFEMQERVLDGKTFKEI